MKRFFLPVLVLIAAGGFLVERYVSPKLSSGDLAKGNLVRYFMNSDRKGTVRDKEGSYKVARVIDGDTIELQGGERVRYIGIDTPETVDPRKPVQCFGIEASRKNKELVRGKTVRLEKDVSDRDKYGRLLRYVFLGTDFINLELVKQGYAFSYTYQPDIKYQNEFFDAEREAREAKRGLWNACANTN